MAAQPNWRVRLLVLLVSLPLALTTGLVGSRQALAETAPTNDPPLGLPFAPGTPEVLLAGPHQNNAHQCTSSAPCNSLDIAPASGTNFHVTAAAPGVVQGGLGACAPGLVFIRHTTNGAYNGWWTGYYHLVNIQVHQNDHVSEGTWIGDLAQTETVAKPCGGSWDRPHVHFDVKYAPPSCAGTGPGTCIGDAFGNTTYDVALGGVALGGWRVLSTNINSCMQDLSAPSTQRCPPSDQIHNYGLSGGATSATNLLQSASFESGPLTGWQLTPGANSATYTNGTAHDGQTFLELNSGSLGGGGAASLHQDVSINTSPGQSFAFSAWLRSATGAPAGICVVLWGLGGSQEGGGSQQTCTTLTSTAWRMVTAPLDTHASAHTTLRAQLYLETASVNYDVDGAQLISTGLNSASFETGPIAGWQLTPGANSATYANGTAHDGQSFLEMNSGSLGGGGAASLHQDVSIPTNPGQSFAFSVWLRSASGSPVIVCLALWGLGGTQEGGGSQQTCPTVAGTAWALATVPLDTHASAHSTVRAQIYLESAGPNLDVDGAQLVNTSLDAASFEGGSRAGWQLTPGGNWATYSDGTAHDGQTFLQANSGSLGGGGAASIHQDVPLNTSVGQSFTFSVWMRSASGDPAGVCVVLWGFGGTQEGGGSQQTCATLTTHQWRVLTVPLDTHASAHNTLRAQIYLETANLNYDIDGATLAIGGAQTPAPSADLDADITGPATGSTGQSLGYTVTATNAGPTAAAPVTGFLILPTNATVVSKPSGCATGTTTVGAGNTPVRYVACPLSSYLAPTLSASFAATVSYASAGTHTAYGYVTSQTPDPAKANNVAPRATTIS